MYLFVGHPVELEHIQPSLHLPPTSYDGTNPEQDPSVSEISVLHSDKSVEAKGEMVPEDPYSSCQSSGKASPEHKHSHGQGRVRVPASHTHRGQDQVRCLAAFRQGRPSIGRLSIGALNTLQSSWAEATKVRYGLGLRLYFDYCREHFLDKSVQPVGQDPLVCRFLSP